VTALLKHQPPGAMVLDATGASTWCEARSLLPGMRMMVAAGERLAADGMVREGRAVSTCR